MTKREGNGTKFLIDRKIFTSDVWSASPWKFKVWFYLIGHANYKDNSFMGIKLKRGQLIRSYRIIAKDIGYKIGYRLKKPSPETIRRICEELTKEERIRQQTTRLGTLFTVCNYSNLQRFPKHKVDNEVDRLRDSSGTVAGQDKNVKNDKNKIYNLFNYWNSLKIITHKNIKKFEGALKSALRDYKPEEIEKAMGNYNTVLRGEDYFWTYKWTLKEFLHRGLDKFLDINKPLENFLKQKEGEKQPMTKGTKEDWVNLKKAKMELEKLASENRILKWLKILPEFMHGYLATHLKRVYRKGDGGIYDKAKIRYKEEVGNDKIS